jgi:hypothetical protein
MPQVATGVVLSVAVRSGPARTAVNGTLVAQPARTTMLAPGRDGSQLVRKLRPVVVFRSSATKDRSASRARQGRSLRRPMVSVEPSACPGPATPRIW